MSLPGYPTACALLFRGDNPPQQLIPTGTITPQTKAAALAHACSPSGWNPQPSDLILVGFGSYDFSVSQFMLPPCTLRGMGRGCTIFTSSWFDWGSGTRVAYAFSNGSVVEDLGMSQATTGDPTVDGICTGFPAGNISATLRRVNITGREWGLYCWYPGCTLYAEDSSITGGRVVVANEDSGLGSNFTLRRCQIVGDASISSCTQNYDVSNPRNGGVFGVVARGGSTMIHDTTIQIKGAPMAGQPQLPRACAITDVGGDNNAPANQKLGLDNVRISVMPGGAPNWYDVDLQYPYTQAAFSQWDCRGSNGDGTLNRSWLPALPVPPPPAV